MRYQELQEFALRRSKERPEHRGEILDILSLAQCEIDEGGSEAHECELAYDDILGITHVSEDPK